MRRSAAFALVIGAVLMLTVTPAAPALAQDAGARDEGRRYAVDTVVGYQDYGVSDTDWPAQYVFDAFGTVAIRRHWQVSFRPKLWRTRGDWHLLVDQASIQAEFRKGSNWRVEAGRFPMPIGLGLTENRADLNAGMIWWHRAYYMPLPFLGADVPRVSLVSAVYPSGAQVSTSGDHWDARAAVVDLSPIEFWRRPEGAARRPNAIAGGGVSPWQGFRVGLAGAWGEFAAPTGNRDGLRYAMTSAEGEYAFGYTKISGEWTRDRIDTPTGVRISSGWTMQGQQTLTPRIFAHVRGSMLRSPEVSRSGPLTVTARTFASIDTTVGYRVTPSVTVRVGHSAIRNWTASTWEQQAGVSLMWATRWW